MHFCRTDFPEHDACDAILLRYLLDRFRDDQLTKRAAVVVSGGSSCLANPKHVTGATIFIWIKSNRVLVNEHDVPTD